MRSSSMKKALPRLTRCMILILILLILPVNICLQLFLQHQSQMESSKEMFVQLEQLIESNESTLEKTKKDFSRKCIQSAEMAAYFVEHSPRFVNDLEHTRELADKLDVDELHFFTPEGEIYAGTHPEYYGYTFESGEQMRYFLPMLTNHALKLCQDIEPNAAEEKEMQYAAVWMSDGSGIIQIGMEPRRVLSEMKEKDLENVLSTFPMDLRGYLHVVDKNTGIIKASTSEKIVGRDVNEQWKKYTKASPDKINHLKFDGVRYCAYAEPYKDYILVRTYLSSYAFQSSVVSTVLVLLYIVLAAVGVIAVIGWYLNKKIAGNLTFIVNDLKKIEEGNLDNITIKTGIIEFDELIHYINQLFKSIRLNWSKLSYVIDKGRIPIGIFEENIFYKKQFINERMLEILGIEDDENMPLPELAKLIKWKLDVARETCLDEEENIFEYNKNGEKIQIGIENIIDEQSVTYYVTDVTQWWNEINELREQSSRDSLTGLYNRRGFGDYMEEAFENPHEVGTAAVVMLDADGLKPINDFYGHHVGDRYLQDIAQIMSETIGDRGICARLGGDEFAAFIYGVETKEEIADMIEQIKNRRGEAFVPGKDESVLGLEFSVGYACCPDDGGDYHKLIYMADERMYGEKKKRKKNTKNF